MAYIPMPRPQGSGFYNPNLPGPDWSRGIGGIINQIVQRKMYEEEQGREERRWQDQMEFKEKGLTAQQDYWSGTIRAREESARLAAGKKSSFAERVDAGVEAGLSKKESILANLNYQPSKTVPKNVIPGFDLFMKDEMGEDWRDKLAGDYNQYLQLWSRFRSISEKTEKDEGKELGTITRQGIGKVIVGIDNIMKSATGLMDPSQIATDPIVKALRERRKELSKYSFKPRFTPEDLEAIKALSDLESIFGGRKETTTDIWKTDEDLKKK